MYFLYSLILFLSLKCLKNDESIMTYENIDFLFEYPFLQDYIKADILSFNPDHPFQQYQLEAGAGAKKGEIKMLPKIDRKLKLDSYQSETNPFFTYQWTYVNDNTSTNSVTTNLKYKFEQSFEDQTPYEFTTSSGRSYKFIPFCKNISFQKCSRVYPIAIICFSFLIIFNNFI